MFEEINSIFPIIVLIMGCAIFIYLITNMVYGKEGFKEGVVDAKAVDAKVVDAKVVDAKAETSISDNTRSILKNLTVDSNRQKYEDRIIDTNDWVDSKIIEYLVSNGVNPST